MHVAQIYLPESGETTVAMRKSASDMWRTLGNSPFALDTLVSERSWFDTAYAKAQPIESSSIRFAAPIRRPSKILAIGQNYMDHIREQNGTPPTKPLIFAKMPSSILDPHGVITWDPTLATMVDYEAELTVIIGKPAFNIAPDRILDYVFGYTCANDITARDLQKSDGQWTRAKGMDTFCPLGPYIVTAEEVQDVQNISVRCELNGETVQESNTKEMIFDVKTILSYMSRTFTLMPGDVILTGTPNGVGMYRTPQRLLREGDRIVVEVGGIGRLENTCHEQSGA